MNTLLVVSCLLIARVTAEVTTEFQGMMFLNRFGYISDNDMSQVSNMDDDIAKEIMRSALQEYQERNGLEITGTMNKETMTEMGRPRCGVKDVDSSRNEDMEPENLRRTKRYALRTRWRNTMLSYRYIRTRLGNKNRFEFDRELDRAFRTWSSESPLRFRNVTNRDTPVEIEVQFARRNHGDNADFDGPSGRTGGQVLAHAFYPSNHQLGGKVHFDDEERWVINSTNGVDFFSVALHEIGHAIGLDHSSEKKAIMYATYTPYIPGVGLHADDIAGVNAHYRGFSARRTPPRRRPGPATQGAPSLCQITSLNAAFSVPGTQDIYIFKDLQCYLLQDGLTGKTTEGYPRPISEEFPGVQVLQRLDAALSWSNGQIFLFERDKVWTLKALKNGSFETASSQAISQVFRDIPNDLTGACLWAGDGRTYFFKGGQYWRYDNTTRSNPQSIRLWRGVSGPVDAVLDLHVGSDTYFFQDDKYYRYNNIVRRVNPGYPRSTRENLFACTVSSKVTSPDDENEDDIGLIEAAESSCQHDKDSKTLPSSGGRYYHSCILTVVSLSLSFIVIALGCEL